MKSIYMRKAWYLDEVVLIEGWVDKYGYHPAYGIPCGFGLIKIAKRTMMNKLLFFDLKKAKQKYPNAAVVCAKEYEGRKDM